MLQYPEYAALIIKLPLATNNNPRSTKNILKAISSLQNNVVSIYKKIKEIDVFVTFSDIKIIQ